MSLIEEYIKRPAFKNHVNKVIYLYDRDKRFINDIVHDFFIYYADRPDKKPNIRKLYNLMIDRLKHEKRYIMIDFSAAIWEEEDLFEY